MTTNYRGYVIYTDRYYGKLMYYIKCGSGDIGGFDNIDEAKHWINVHYFGTNR